MPGHIDAWLIKKDFPHGSFESFKYVNQMDDSTTHSYIGMFLQIRKVPNLDNLVLL